MLGNSRRRSPLICGNKSEVAKLVRLGGFEPPTSGATILRSNQLSYNRMVAQGAAVHYGQISRFSRALGDGRRAGEADRAKKKGRGEDPAFSSQRPAPAGLPRQTAGGGAVCRISGGIRRA